VSPVSHVSLKPSSSQLLLPRLLQSVLVNRSPQLETYVHISYTNSSRSRNLGSVGKPPYQKSDCHRSRPSRKPSLPLLPFCFLPCSNPFLFAVSVCLKIVCTHLPISAVSMQALQAPGSCLLTWVEKFSRLFTFEFLLCLVPWSVHCRVF
jgi:hypothetical protein